MNLDFDDFFDDVKLKSKIQARIRELIEAELKNEKPDVQESQAHMDKNAAAARNARDLAELRKLAGLQPDPPVGPENQIIKEHKFWPDPPPPPPKRIIREDVNPAPGIAYGKAMAIILLVALISAAIPATIYLIST